MSELNLPESEVSIITELETLGLPVYEIEMPEDSALNYNKFGKLASPFYVISFAGPLSTEYGDRSLCGAADDPVKAIVSVQTVGGDTASVRAAHGNMMDLLTGFYPADSGEMRFGGGNGYSIASNVVRPTLYVRVAFYTYKTNIISG